jgi:hypothetical protein
VLTLADATGSFNLKLWADAPPFGAAQGLPDGSAVRLDGEWAQNHYGLDVSGVPEA